MEREAAKEWFLRKQEDGTVFGPLSFELLSRWASAAQVAPNDVVSNDQQAWIKAPMVPELGMDWLVELTSERYYGPTTLGAVQEFIRLGEINAETFIINSCDGVRKKIGDFPMLRETSQPGSFESETTDMPAPAAAGISINAAERIRELEQTLHEERRALQEADARYRELEKKYLELTHTSH